MVRPLPTAYLGAICHVACRGEIADYCGVHYATVSRWLRIADRPRRPGAKRPLSTGVFGADPA
jgi:hypothetical protein